MPRDQISFQKTVDHTKDGPVLRLTFYGRVPSAKIALRLSANVLQESVVFDVTCVGFIPVVVRLDQYSDQQTRIYLPDDSSHRTVLLTRDVLLVLFAESADEERPGPIRASATVKPVSPSGRSSVGLAVHSITLDSDAMEEVH